MSIGEFLFFCNNFEIANHNSHLTKDVLNFLIYCFFFFKKKIIAIYFFVNFKKKLIKLFKKVGSCMSYIKFENFKVICY